MEFRVVSSGLEFRIQDLESLGFRLVGLGLAVGSTGFVVGRGCSSGEFPSRLQ